MQINAIGSTSFKGATPEIIDLSTDEYKVIPSKVSLEEEMDKFEKASDLFGQLVDSEDMKGPVAAVASVGYAGVKSFAKGAATALLADKLFNNKPSELFKQGLKKGSELAENASVKLLTSEGKKISKFANIAGEAIDKTNGALKQAYKTISKNSATKGLAIVGGALTALALVPGLLKKDSNEDGVADIMQKSQNVYAQNTQKLDKFQEKMGVAAELAQLLS